MNTIPEPTITTFDKSELITYNQQLLNVDFNNDSNKNASFQPYGMECMQNPDNVERSVTVNSQVTVSSVTNDENEYQQEGTLIHC